ncbi:apolipoprotein N-acyltransferase [Geothermobacter ehrlichii]|uniref:Apolipoprotein N-acyltransferase n=1 Tax=Geothermobacter ehrlichii TaxID=213224 RepID=A0A5D3WN86_9BACT|nr:apolipoprotein N-acyltransferase [Geothermobacter ehrlichii]TYP00032.1 apolipoprotein N-acyltransferase [Geothermobacter ehrlichii]
MKTETAVRRFFRPDLVAAAGSGLLVALAFPRPSLYPLAWIGFAPLLVSGSRRPFRAGMLAGTVFFGLVLYWLNIVMTTYGRLALPLALAAWLLLSVYLALFWAVPFWGALRLRAVCRFPLTLVFPVFWVGCEYLRGWLLTGFPWALLGYSQHPFSLVLQTADLFGVYGVSFLVALVNALLAEIVLGRKDGHPLPVRSLLAVGCLLAAALGYGAWRLDTPAASPQQGFTVALAQGNIDQAQKWDARFLYETLDIYRRLSRQASRAGAELTVWPESATPFYFQEPGRPRSLVVGAARELGGFLLFGAPAYEREGDRVRFYNSAYLLNAAGEVLGRSDKIHLVPFGEYVPLKWLLPFVDKLVAGIGDFSSGRVMPLKMNGQALGVLVCYEAIFPDIARSYVRRGSDLLVNITNDAWFGRSSAPWQHLEMAAFRAVEQRVWLVRAANTGVSALISPTGKVVSHSRLFEPALVVGRVVPGAGPSLYRRIGDVLPFFCLLTAAGWLWILWRRSSGRAG